MILCWIYNENNASTPNKRMFIEQMGQGRGPKKTGNFWTFIKKGARVRILMEQNIFQKLCHQGGGQNFLCNNFPPLIFPFSTYFLYYFFLNLVQKGEKCLNLLRGEGNFSSFVSIFYVTITQGDSPNLINVLKFPVFLDPLSLRFCNRSLMISENSIPFKEANILTLFNKV